MSNLPHYGKSFSVLTIVQSQLQSRVARLCTDFIFVYLSMGCLSSCLSDFCSKISRLIWFVYLSIWLRSHVCICTHMRACVYPIDRQTDRQNHFYLYKRYIFQLVRLIKICLSSCLSVSVVCLSGLFFGGNLPFPNKKWGVYSWI